jgi:multidrug efflux pump subunit AcrA (membrane-fusion protein)
MKHKQIWISFAVFLALVTMGLVLYFIKVNRSGYEVVLTKEGPVKEAIYGLGTVVSEKHFSFKVGVTQTLQALHIQKGDNVTKGQLLLEFTDGVKVKSPIDGTVLELPFHAGENVFADKPAITVENLHQLYVEARIDQQGALRVKAGLPVQLSFENLREKIFSGTVRSIYPSQGDFVARIQGETLPAEILPGMTADVAIEVAHKDKALLVPVRAINSGHVLVQRGSDRIKVKVEIGISDDEWAEVIGSNLKKDEEVLIKR